MSGRYAAEWEQLTVRMTDDQIERALKLGRTTVPHALEWARRMRYWTCKHGTNAGTQHDAGCPYCSGMVA